MSTYKITKEEKLAQIEEARKCFDEASALIEKGKALIKKSMRGVELCDLSNNCRPLTSPDPEQYRGMVEVHLYSGMSKMEKLLGIKAKPEIDICGNKIRDRKALCVGGIKFFQIGTPTDSKYCYK